MVIRAIRGRKSKPKKQEYSLSKNYNNTDLHKQKSQQTIHKKSVAIRVICGKIKKTTCFINIIFLSLSTKDLFFTTITKNQTTITTFVKGMHWFVGGK